MMNVREIPIGSFVGVYSSPTNLMTCMVVELLRDNRVSVIVYHQTQDDGQYTTGKIHTFPLSQLEGICCTCSTLKNFGFTDSNEKGWKLVYWFGVDMKLLYRPTNKQNLASFRFKSDFRKSYVRISCIYIHELQNIMRFLTGGEMEFEYKNVE